MCLFRKPEKPKYGKVIALTLGAVAAVAAIAYFVYKFFFEYKCDYDCGYEFEKPTPDTPDIPDEPTEPDTPDEPEQELNFFQKIIQWFKNLFAKLFGWLK